MFGFMMTVLLAGFVSLLYFVKLTLGVELSDIPSVLQRLLSEGLFELLGSARS